MNDPRTVFQSVKQSFQLALNLTLEKIYAIIVLENKINQKEK